MKNMLLKLVLKFFNLPFLKKLDGYKSYIGAGLILLSMILEWMVANSALIPQLGVYAITLKAFLDGTIKVLDMLGYGSLTAGIAHDKVKEIAYKIDEK